jgi:cyclic beta-1,2-glucan glucanotransferase
MTMIRKALLHLSTRLRRNGRAEESALDEPPLRAELFSSDQMEQHGKSLAVSHKPGRERISDRLLARLTENEKVLIGARDLLAVPIETDRRSTPAAEWLLDNFHLIEEQIRTAKRHLPKGYSRELPRLLDGPSAGLPRVYDLALETISHGDGRVDPEILGKFVAAYQRVTALKLGELWAIPIMLRLALIENLRRVAARIATYRLHRNRADHWADRMMEIAREDPKGLILVVADMARSNPPMASSFVAEFARRLQGQSSALALPLTWIEQMLSESGLTIESLIRSEHQQQAADQVSISNSIGSLRLLSEVDWRDFVETSSRVEQKLLEDPCGVYGKMDFATRDRYRHVVEDIAKRSRFSEFEVAHRTIQLARDGAARNGDAGREAHVGFYLIDRGRAQLERSVEARLSGLAGLRRMGSRHAWFLYLGTILLLTAMFSSGLLAEARAGGTRGGILALFAVLSVLGSSQLAVALVSWLATLLVTPKRLPRMDFAKGIPPECRTLVVVPTMLANAQSTKDLLEALEVRFLGNRSENLHFALLTDFQDAHEETTSEDEPLLRLARDGIDELNQKYRSARNDTFFLFHRPRRWNPAEGVWMGYERKRGKLAELDSFLRGGSAHLFLLVAGETAVLSNVRYVITLDTDTQLPRDSARRLVGAMAHPLNQARYDERMQRVCEGYGILQPRVAVSLPSTKRSRYAQLFGSEPGIDPYTRIVSDVFQDLFREGSFIGKGIYEVDTFERSLAGHFPENTVLSHDLLEGCYARSGLLSDVPLYEEYPPSYSADVSRRHRWIRGDWQLARWLLPRLRGPGGKLQKSPLSALSRWKLLDNLRRSLVPAALTLLLVLGWTLLSPRWSWTLSVLGILLLPPLAASVLALFQKPQEVLLRQHLTAAARSGGRHFAQAVFALACLPYEGFFSLDAIVRTVWRMLVTHTRLLEWNPSSQPQIESNASPAGFFLRMWIAPALAGATVIHLTLSRPLAAVMAGPMLALWLASPAVAWWISKPLLRRKARLTDDQTLFLRKLSRKTWRFFEAFVGPQDHWLPPDNVQEHPVSVVAHRTSPTNMGLALLSDLSAYDFGFIPAGELLERVTHAFEAMKAMERHRGHFYNWYDTRSLKPLTPVYISTVDSGNLAGHLLTLRPGLLALPDDKILGARWLDGIRDTFSILLDHAGAASLPRLSAFRNDLESALLSPPDTLTLARSRLEHLASSAAKIAAEFEAVPENEASWWAHALARQCRVTVEEVAFLVPGIVDLDGIPTLRELAKLETEGSVRARERIGVIEGLAVQCSEFAQMEADFLFDKARGLLAIGYDVAGHRRDSSSYDLLASEARLCSFVAIAQGKLPQESWFGLGRLLTNAGGKPILLSWSGSMFEYLMPLLVMPTYENTLLDDTYKAAVERQIEYGAQRGVPWGISECGYNMLDAHQNYQYRAFGVPGLGLKRGLAEDLVIAPYASALALMVAPEEACLNLQRLAAEGLEGRYGFHEAVDYTPARLPRGRQSTVIRSFMAHHQGMSLLSLAYLLLDRPMQKRFTSDPWFQATTLLLQERIPRATPFYARAEQLTNLNAALGGLQTPVRVIDTPNTRTPELQLLSNGRYHVMVTNAGGGYSRWKDFAVTRWREDSTCDNWGTFCYIRDVKNGKVWSTAYQPTLQPTESYEVIFSVARAEFRCRNHGLETHAEIAVSPEDDIELRRIQITNRSRTPRTIEVTSYAEVVLASPAADALHPAFSNLFVQTEILRERQAILCTRRPRSSGEPTPWMFHLMAVHGADIEEISYETDRMRFIGRGNTVADPQAMRSGAQLSGSEGSVLDPIVAIRSRLTLAPEASASIQIVSGIGETREVCLGLVEKYQDRRLPDRVFDLAWTHGQVLLRQLNATEADAQLYARIAGSIVYSSSALRAESGILIKNRRGQPGLWGYSISGDLPIVVLQIGDGANLDLVRQLVQAHAFWRLKGLATDLLIWNEDHSGYRQLLHDQIMGLIVTGTEANIADRPGGIFVRPAEQISDEDRILLLTVARAIIADSRGTLAEQLERNDILEPRIPLFTPTRSRRAESHAAQELPARDLIFFNGLGGFTPDGREYVITTSKERVTPAPWVNVLANPRFGSVVSESGSAYTWSENAHEFRLTPWHNDPVSDPSGEAFYIRDEESGHFWSPTPLPSRGTEPYVSRHGFGYSVFEHKEDGIRSELWVYVAVDAPVKFWRLLLHNESGRSRRLSATGYLEWVLGDLRPRSMPHLITEIDSDSGAFFARNPYNTELAGRVAFFDVDLPSRSWTGDRREFLGRNGTLRSPAAMARARLSGKVGAALDPCAAIQTSFELGVGQEREILFRLGAGRDTKDARTLVQRFRGSAAARTALESVWQFWKHSLGAVYVETPDPALNVMANGWLLYQTLACRLWARSGAYQSGGAFGFRDQLQDVMALLHAEPRLMREQLLLCAAHQFPEGDVQHWWHPPVNRGVRTHCSDDFLWLPLVTSRYVLGTGDTGVLDEPVSFIEGRPLDVKADSYYDLPTPSAQKASLYEHCVRAILRGLSFGEHGLPLMGSGDWNDGMNLVGIGGKGESVWLGFFLCEVLRQFTAVARIHADVPFAERCEEEADVLRQNIEQHGWDGDWYRRAYFDDGSPLGSASNAECQIDSIAQSWAVLAGAGEAGRSHRSMDAVDRRLVRREHALIQLLDPPFDRSELNPGYIKGYVPGVRENGGQYTHAAVWAAMAFAALGDSSRAWELFDLINPVNHAKTPEKTAIYRVEPYVVAADVYSLAPHTGRGGWTWYTGSAGWLYRLIVESLLGLRLEVDRLRFAPCLRADWKAFKVHYRYRETFYHIAVAQTRTADGKSTVTVDGLEQPDLAVLLVDDRAEHSVEVSIGSPPG